MGTGKALWNQFETLFSKKDWEDAASLFATDAVHVDPFGRREGREAIRAWWDERHKAFSDLNIEASLVIEEGDTVVAEWTWRATHTGPMAMPDGTEIPPTGKTLEFPGVDIGEVRDGKFATLRGYFDTTAAMSQLGLIPGS